MQHSRATTSFGSSTGVLLLCVGLLISCACPNKTKSPISHPPKTALPAALAPITPPSTDPVPASLALYVAEQEGLLAEYEHSTVLEHRERSARLLCALWEAGLISEEVWGRLLDRHYHVVLIQYIAPQPDVCSWHVEPQFSFPFPNQWTDFTPTLFRNGEVKWALGTPQLSCGLTAVGNPIASMTGGEFANDDELQCRIDVQQIITGKCWRRSLWTNKIILRNIRE